MGDANYGIDADSNRNGAVDKTDLKLAKENLGVSTTILPTLNASIAASSTFNATTRTSSAAGVTITGTTTPGAVIQLTELDNKVPKVGTTAGPSGSFQLSGQLAVGEQYAHAHRYRRLRAGVRRDHAPDLVRHARQGVTGLMGGHRRDNL